MPWGCASVPARAGGWCAPERSGPRPRPEFDVPQDHPARRIATEAGLEAEGNLILRRILGADGRNRATLNDQPVSAVLLREVGATLVEIQGQHEQHGLLDQATHIGLLDRFAGLGPDSADLSAAWTNLGAARDALGQGEAAAAAAQGRRGLHASRSG